LEDCAPTVFLVVLSCLGGFFCGGFFCGGFAVFSDVLWWLGGFSDVLSWLGSFFCGALVFFSAFDAACFATIGFSAFLEVIQD
jgi:hypothetical protein